MVLDDDFISLHSASSLSFYQQLDLDMIDQLTSARLFERFAYAFEKIDSAFDARRFVLGYIADISQRPWHYDTVAHSDPQEYVFDELQSALELYFIPIDMSDEWRNILEELDSELS